MQSQLIDILINAVVYSMMAFTFIGSGILFAINFAEEIKSIENQFNQFNKKGDKLFLETGIV